MEMTLRALLLAAALSLWAMPAYAAEDITVYKDAT
jgi:predicted porin